MNSKKIKKEENLDIMMLTEEEILLLESNQKGKNISSPSKEEAERLSYSSDFLIEDEEKLNNQQKKEKEFFFSGKGLEKTFFNDKIGKEYSSEENILLAEKQGWNRLDAQFSEDSLTQVSYYMENRLDRRDTVTIRTIPLGSENSLTISETHCSGKVVAICSINGYLDQSNADLFQKQLISMIEFGVRFFVIDLGLTYMVGSSGWGALAIISKLVKNSKGHLIVCEMKEEVKESFYLLQFNEVIEVKNTLDESLQFLTSFIEGDRTNYNGEKNDPKESQFVDNCADLPLPEKVKDIISRYGEISFFNILSRLKEDKYGRVRINPLKLYFLLRELNLDAKWKRLRYYRSS